MRSNRMRSGNFITVSGGKMFAPCRFREGTVNSGSILVRVVCSNVYRDSVRRSHSR